MTTQEILEEVKNHFHAMHMQHLEEVREIAQGVLVARSLGLEFFFYFNTALASYDKGPGYEESCAERHEHMAEGYPRGCEHREEFCMFHPYPELEVSNWEKASALAKRHLRQIDQHTPLMWYDIPVVIYKC